MAAFSRLLLTHFAPSERSRDEHHADMPFVDKKGAALGHGSLV